MEKQNPITVLGQKVHLFQPQKGGFRTSMDSVLLAAACPAQGQDHVLDMGCGGGGASFCLLWREQKLTLTGIDIDPDFIDLARQNAVLNQCQERSHFLHHGIGAFLKLNKKPAFDHVMMNPPFFDAGSHSPSQDQKRLYANGHGAEDSIGLEDWIGIAHKLLKSRGSLTLIYPVSPLDRILACMHKRFGAIHLYPILSKSSEPAKRIIVIAIKDRQSQTVLQPPIVLHDQKGSPTQQSDLLLREGLSFRHLYRED
jgi:tRNA1(Val) A37 N6-methylase TrmN6